MSDSGNLDFNDLRKYDYDHYILNLFAPAEKRSELAILYLFNSELTKIKLFVSETMLGLIRLQWWKEAIEEIYQGKILKSHPILEKLGTLINKYNLDKEYFLRLLEGRKKEFDEKPKNIAELEKQGQQSVASLFFISALILNNGKELNKNLRETLNHIGIAWHITSILRLAHVIMPNDPEYFPQELAEKHKLYHNQYGSQNFLVSASALTEELIDKIKFHLTEAREFKWQKSDKIFAPIFLHTALTESYLSKIKNNKYDIVSGHLTLVDPLSMTKLYLRALISKF